MKIANIIYEEELVNHTKVKYVNYINKPTRYDDIDKTLPTLYVGWSFMKKCNPENSIIQNADILKKKIITNELYWEFSFLESKPSHVKGVDTFARLAPQFNFSPKYIYTNLDPVFFNIRDIDDIVDILPKKINTYYIYKDNMMYILSDNKIYGLDLEMYKFFLFNIDELINRVGLLSIDSNLTRDVDGLIYEKYYKLFPNFEQLKRYLVTF